MDRRIVSAALFYCAATPIAFLYFFTIFYVADTAVQGLLLAISVLIVFALVSHLLVTRVSKERWNLGWLGLRRKGLLQSFLLASIPAIVGPLDQLYVISNGGVGDLAQSILGSYPGSVNEILRSLPASLIFFLLTALLAFGFFQAFPGELLRRRKLRLLIPVMVVMWALLYGSAHIVRGFVPSFGDIVLFGFLFLLVYLRTGNSVGPILAYTLIAEEPAWAALALFSAEAYIVSLYVKVLWSVVALIVTATRWRWITMSIGRDQ